VGQARVKVMTHQFRLRTINDTDGALEAFHSKRAYGSY